MNPICYSADGEDFRHIEIGDLFNALASDGEVYPGREYYESDYKPMTAAFLMRERHVTGALLERLDIDLVTELGDIAGPIFTECSLEAHLELDKLLRQWIEDNIPVGRWYKLVGQVRTKQITQDDLD